MLGIVTFIPLIYAATTNAALSTIYPELVPANVRFTSFNFAYQTATVVLADSYHKLVQQFFILREA